jgi:hypothetical protein
LDEAAATVGHLSAAMHDGVSHCLPAWVQEEKSGLDLGLHGPNLGHRGPDLGFCGFAAEVPRIGGLSPSGVEVVDGPWLITM